MRRTVTPGILMAISLIVLANAQPDPQTALWTQIKKQLSGPEGQRFFEANLKGAALPMLKGTLVSALINPGVSRLILKMPGSEAPDVTLIVYDGSAELAANPTPGRAIEFYGRGESFSAKPFMLTFELDIEDLQGVEFATPARKTAQETNRRPLACCG